MSDDHWMFIAIAYGVAIAAIGAVAGKIVIDYKRLQADLARFDGESQRRGETQQ